jgi:hypothetical protein
MVLLLCAYMKYAMCCKVAAGRAAELTVSYDLQLRTLVVKHIVFDALFYTNCYCHTAANASRGLRQVR